VVGYFRTGLGTVEYRRVIIWELKAYIRAITGSKLGEEKLQSLKQELPDMICPGFCPITGDI